MADQDVYTRMMTYLTHVHENRRTIIPQEKQHRYCLLFGTNVLHAFATRNEAEARMRDLPFLVLTLVPPLGVALEGN